MVLGNCDVLLRSWGGFSTSVRRCRLTAAVAAAWTGLDWTPRAPRSSSARLFVLEFTDAGVLQTVKSTTSLTRVETFPDVYSARLSIQLDT